MKTHHSNEEHSKAQRTQLRHSQNSLFEQTAAISLSGHNYVTLSFSELEHDRQSSHTAQTKPAHGKEKHGCDLILLDKSLEAQF